MKTSQVKYNTDNLTQRAREHWIPLLGFFGTDLEISRKNGGHLYSPSNPTRKIITTQDNPGKLCSLTVKSIAESRGLVTGDFIVCYPPAWSVGGKIKIYIYGAGNAPVFTIQTAYTEYGGLIEDYYILDGELRYTDIPLNRVQLVKLRFMKDELWINYNQEKKNKSKQIQATINFNQLTKSNKVQAVFSNGGRGLIGTGKQMYEQLVEEKLVSYNRRQFNRLLQKYGYISIKKGNEYINIVRVLEEDPSLLINKGIDQKGVIENE
jgi:hypothetical protein